MKIIAMVVAVSAAAGAFNASASDSFEGALPPAPTHPALYSFADVYRLTVSGSAQGGVPLVPALDSPMRVAAGQGAQVPELRFTVLGFEEPERWTLILAGLALALWVARRRLSYFF